VSGVPLESKNSYSLDQCKVDLKINWGCVCKGGSPCTSPSDFDCSKASGTTYYLAMLYEMWDTGMWILGGVGAGVAVILIAIPAFAAAMSGSGSVVAFSVCSGLFCGPYLFIGACFATVASAWRLVHVFLTLKFVVFFFNGVLP